ncbi:MAG: TonB-dependent receptor [Pseudoxanthomonas sp.]
MRRPALNHFMRLGCIPAYFALTLAHPVMAAETEQAQTDPAQGGSAATQLDTITVTVQKHAQTLQETPAAVSAFSAEQIKQMGATRASDIVTHVPNADFFSFFGESQNPSFCFRGICLTKQFGDGFEPPVAMYADEVYVSSAFGQALQLFDVERVEVAKGPQGTLYGRNTTGGLVNVITNKPTDHLEASLSQEVGTWNNRLTEGFISGPISEHVRGRLAAQVHKRDGYVNSELGGAKANDIDTQAVRGILDIDVSDTTSLELRADYFRVDQGAQAYGINGTLDPDTGAACSLGQLAGGNCVGIYDGSTLSANKLYGSFSPTRWYGADIPGNVWSPRNAIQNRDFAATLKRQMAGWEFTSITGYSQGHKEIVEDLDGDIGYGMEDRLTANTKTFSQELRASGDWGRANWLLGAFYYHDDRDMTTALIPVSDYYDSSNKKTDSYALFANLEVPFAEQWKVILGGRYSYEKRDVTFSRSGDYTTSTISNAKVSFSGSHFDPKAVLQWQPNRDFMAYGSVSTAYRSRDVNTQWIYGNLYTGTSLDQLKPLKPEVLTSYELGFKSDLWDRRLRVNASLFYYDFKDMQTSLYVYDDDAGKGTSVMRNLDKIEVWGGETDIQALLFEGLTATLGFGVTHSEIKSHATAKTVGGDYVDLYGNELPMSGKNVSLGLTYNQQLRRYGSIDWHADYRWKDSHYFTVFNQVTAQSPSYALVDFNIAWNSPGGAYRVELFGKNVTDKKYWLYASEVYTNTQQVVWGEPRTYGLRFTWNYF